MQVTFLEAPVPLIKRYTATEKDNYPRVRDFTSSTLNVNVLSDLEQEMLIRASKGHCLLKGNLDRPIKHESRAGHTVAEDPTEWICLDIDGMTSVTSIDALLAKMELADVSYILQWSSSYGVNGNFDLRAHVYILLTKPAHPFQLKLWLKHLNLTHFTADLSLAKSNVSLKWGLDISTCQNDKLLYISPPDCDPPSINTFTGQRIALIPRANDRADISSHLPTYSIAVIQQAEIKEINRLRQTKGLKSKAESKYKLRQGPADILYMPNPDHCQVSGKKTERGFTYLNLDGGDSWGYYHPEDNPEFLYNFKGEPIYKTAELIPEYLAPAKQAAAQAKKAAHPNKLFLGFRDFRTATYWNGWYDLTLDEITLHPARSERQIMDFYLNYNQAEPEPLPIWNKAYLPSAPAVDTQAKIVNTFQPSRYMRATQNGLANPNTAGHPTPIIDHLLDHVLGPELVPHFINWLAHIYQHRTLPKTAWILHGIQGTGKGILFYHVLKPLLGPSNATQRRMEELKDAFNAYMEESLLIVIDEAQVSESGKQHAIMANLKNQITEDRITIRRMRTDAYEVDNHAGYIFCSNMPDPVIISPTDRRFNVGAYQKIQYTPTDSDLLQIEQIELECFAHMLALHKIDPVAVRTPLMTQAKLNMQHASMTSSEELAETIKNGDMDELLECMPTGTPQRDMLEAHDYKALILDLLTTGRKNLHRDELFTLFNYAVGNVPHNTKKFTSYLRHKDIELKVVKVNGKAVRGFQLDHWKQDPTWFAEKLLEHSPTANMPVPGTVTPIK